jgi:hypothetical protein
MIKVKKLFKFAQLFDFSSASALIGRSELMRFVALRPLDTNTNKVTINIKTEFLTAIFTLLTTKIMIGK